MKLVENITKLAFELSNSTDLYLVSISAKDSNVVETILVPNDAAYRATAIAATQIGENEIYSCIITDPFNEGVNGVKFHIIGKKIVSLYTFRTGGLTNEMIKYVPKEFRINDICDSYVGKNIEGSLIDQ